MMRNMKLLKYIGYFIFALLLHTILLYLFVLGFYTLYFTFLLVSSYILYKYNRYFSYRVFSLLLIFVVVFINLEIYDEYIFEIYLYFDAVKGSIFVNSEVKYVLMTLHLIVLINLKKFENFWAIIDKKVFRI